MVNGFHGAGAGMEESSVGDCFSVGLRCHAGLGCRSAIRRRNIDAFSGVEILMDIAIFAVRVAAAHKLKSEARGFTSV